MPEPKVMATWCPGIRLWLILGPAVSYSQLIVGAGKVFPTECHVSGLWACRYYNP